MATSVIDKSRFPRNKEEYDRWLEDINRKMAARAKELGVPVPKTADDIYNIGKALNLSLDYVSGASDVRRPFPKK